MEKEKITNLDNLPKDTWEQLKNQADKLIENSKIGFFQGTALLDLCKTKISEFKTDDDKSTEESLKELAKEVLG